MSNSSLQSFLRDVVADPWCFLLYTAFVYVAIYILFVWLLPRDKKWWKRTDYVWLTAAILGAIPIVLENRQEFSNFVAEQSLGAAKLEYDFARQQAEFNATHHCRTFERSKFSPADFDEVVAVYRQACTRSQGLLQGFPDWITDSPPVLQPLLESLTQMGNRILDEDFERLRNSIESYESQRQRLASARDDSEPSYLREVLTSMSPILLGFAIALRLVRIEGEIRSDA